MNALMRTCALVVRVARIAVLTGWWLALLSPVVAQSAEEVDEAAETTPAADVAAELRPLAEAALPATVASPARVSVQTVDGERIDADVTEVRDGALLLATEPPRSIPLIEIDVVEFVPSDADITVEWLGQDNHDFARPAREIGPSGVQDIHLRVHGLTAGRAIKQLTVSGAPANNEVWALDTAAINSWRLVLRSADGDGPSDVYLEPTQWDTFDKDYVLAVKFADGGEGKATIDCSIHSDGTLAANPEEDSVQPGIATSAAETTEPGQAAATDLIVFPADREDQFRVSRLSLTDDLWTARVAWGSQVRIPSSRLRGMRFPAASTETTEQRFAARLAAPAVEDTVLVAVGDGSISEIAGQAESLDDDRLRFRYEGKIRSINRARLLGLVLGSPPDAAANASAFQVLELIGGDRLSGNLIGVSVDDLELVSTWAESLKVPRSHVRRLSTRNGRLVYLSDLSPDSVEETAWFGRARPWRRDQGWSEGPPTLAGRAYRKGLAVHARSVLTFDLAGQFQTLKALVGFDNSSAGQGRVRCRVLADDRELFAEDDLRADGEPLTLELSVSGTRRLTLEVDFGAGQDVGDRVIWADARLIR